ncbi:MAG: hypothetical protein GWN16_06110, partial [Calditrichae bacterium]|nr:hypothetical protein [Calditrichia bacterium]
RHLFTDDSEEAHQLYRRLQAGESFETLAAQVFEDTLLSRNGGDLGWVKAGDLDDEFSNAALNLNKGEISPPVQTRWGYHIIQLLDRKEQVMVTESVLNAQRSSLEKRIRRKKSRRLANRYITDVMADLNPQPNPQKFRRLWNAVVPKDEREKSELSFKVSF